MHGIKLLEHALSKKPKRVLDVGVGHGGHAKAFIANGAEVVGIDVRDAPHEHPKYQHIQAPIETIEVKDKSAEMYDLVWSCHTLEHVPTYHNIMVRMADWLKDDGWLYIAVPTNTQDRLHIGHLTLWSPALLVYNLITAGWDCKDAEWYTNYQTIGLCMQKKRIADMSWRTGMPNEEKALNQFSPVPMGHDFGAWWANRWPTETIGRTSDPPQVTAGVYRTNLPPRVELAYGPNPALRKPKGLNGFNV